MKKTSQFVIKTRNFERWKGGVREYVTKSTQSLVTLHKYIEKQWVGFDAAADLYEEIQISLAKQPKEEYNAVGLEKQHIFDVFQ